MGFIEQTCNHCGARYLLASTPKISHEPDSVQCPACNEVLHTWHTGVGWEIRNRLNPENDFETT